MRPHAEAKVARLAESETVSFGPLAHYNKLTGDDGLPIFTGVQTCKPGYQTPLHWHPYVECLFIIEGAAEAWLEGQEDCPTRRRGSSTVSINPPPACKDDDASAVIASRRRSNLPRECALTRKIAASLRSSQ